MRFIHTSDWHLGRRLHGVDLADDHDAFASWFLDLVASEQADAVLLSGDVFDRAVPPASAISTWEGVLDGLVAADVPIIATSGNHDSFVRLGMNRRQLDVAGIHLRTRLSDLRRPVRFSYDGRRLSPESPEPGISVAGIPYLEPGLVHTRLGAEARTHTAVLRAAMAIVEDEANRTPGDDSLIVLAHAFVAGSTTTESERDVSVGGLGATAAEVFAAADYAALGHLHRPQSLSERIRYSGSPLPFSFDEAAFDKEVVVVDVSPPADGESAAEVACRSVPVPVFTPVVTLRGTLDEVLAQGYEHPDSIVAADLTDGKRIDDALTRLRAAFPGFVRLRWVSLPPPPVSSIDIRGEQAAKRTDEEVFSDFLVFTTGAQPTPLQSDEFRRARETALRISR